MTTFPLSDSPYSARSGEETPSPVTGLLKPQKLNPGDKVAAVSLSWGGPGAFPHRYEAGKAQLQAEFGLNVVEMPHTLSDPAWLARHPQARAADLMAAFADPAIKGIISTIGGSDSIRILPYLDLTVIRANPKIVLGYSDTTITHLACYRAGLATFYGPSVMAGFAENGGLFPYMAESVRKTLFSAEPVGMVGPNPGDWTDELLGWADPANQSRCRQLNPPTSWRFLQGRGVRRGHLLGGCFEVLDFLRGTDFWPGPEVWPGAILFLETSEEAPSPELLKRTLRVYAAMGILSRLSGLLLGRPGGQVPPARHAEYDLALLEVIAQEAELPELPIITGMDFGHTDPMMVLPYGVQAVIDCEARQFSIVESAVTAGRE